jgi:hypothetical protein
MKVVRVGKKCRSPAEISATQTNRPVAAHHGTARSPDFADIWIGTRVDHQPERIVKIPTTDIP